jgi:hypothetical protein
VALGQETLAPPRQDVSIADDVSEERAPEGKQSVLWRSVNIHFPDLRGLPLAERSEKLQDHIVLTAMIRGELAQLRLAAHIDLREAQQEWEDLIPQSGRSKADTDRRRADMRPDLAKKISTAKWTIARCTEEMDRHGGTEYESASRAYTILAGG